MKFDIFLLEFIGIPFLVVNVISRSVDLRVTHAYMLGGGGGGVLNKCLYGEASLPGPTPYPFIYHFSGKRYPFCIPSTDK